MKQITVMLKPASSLCNLRCKYCFYANIASLREVRSFGIMREDVLQAVIDNIFCCVSAGDYVNVVFQGGEPTLAGLGWFRDCVARIEKAKNGVHISYALQTNAVLLDAEWCAFLKEYGFLVGVSLDGPADTHDSCRLDAEGNGTYRAVMQAVQCLNAAAVDYNILLTLTNPAARHPEKIWRFITENDFRHVQFTPCLAGFDETERNPFALTPERFSNFYRRIFKLWFAEFQKDNYYSVKLIDDIINLVAFGEVNACGLTGLCAPQIVVEADGSVYPCDFYMLDQWKTGNLAENTLDEVFQSPVYRRFLTRPGNHTLCRNCPFVRICAGNCLRMRKHICYDEGAQVCAYRAFLEEAMPDIQRLAMLQRQYRR